MKKCKANHGWAYLNKRFDDKELTIIAFCDNCEYIDKKALRLQKALDKAELAYSKYKSISMREKFFFLKPSKEIN